MNRLFTFRLFNVAFLITTTFLLYSCGGGGGGGGGGTDSSNNEPDSFTFTDQTDVELSIVVTSNSITISGLDEAAAISITDGEYSIDSGSYTDVEGTIENNQSVTVRQTSSDTVSTTTDAILTIANVSDTFSVTTQATDTTPDDFSFNDQTGVALDTVISSNSITISGIEAATSIGISDGEFSINGGSFEDTDTTVTEGQTVVVRHTSASLPESLSTTTLTIGGISRNFNSTTGDLGTSFNKARGFNNRVHALSATFDGSNDIYVGGRFTTFNDIASIRLIRLNADSTVDSSFDTGDGFDLDVKTILTMDDGSNKIYVGGSFSTYKGVTANRIIRLNSDGSIDESFSTGSGFDDDVETIVSANDGSGDIYVGGRFTIYNGMSRVRITRLNSDGSIDSSFFVGTGFNDTVQVITVSNDGSDIYAGGRFTSYDGDTSNRIIRLDNGGIIDITFSIGTGFDNTVSAISLDEDALYVGGAFTTYGATSVNRIIRLNSNGSIPLLFNSGVASGFNSTVFNIDVATDGSDDIYVSGNFSTYNDIESRRIIRLENHGGIDTDFTIGEGFSSTVQTSLLSNDGSSIILGGSFADYQNVGRNHLAQLNSEGDLNSYLSGTGTTGEVNVIIATTDASDDIYVAGSFESYNGVLSENLVRLNSDGSADTDFVVGSGFSNSVSTLEEAQDGSGDIYVGGSFLSYNGTISNRIIRLNNNGTVDATFNYGSGFDSSVREISAAIDSSGDIYVGGFFADYNGTPSNNIIRLNSDGSVDSGFNIGGGFDDAPSAIEPALDGSGDIYVGGRFTSYDGTTSNQLVRLNSDGTIDPAFNVGVGFGSSSLTPQIFTIHAINDGSGDIYVGGFFNDYKGDMHNHLLRLNTDGSVDTEFNTEAGFDGRIVEISPALGSSTNDIYVGGEFQTYKGNINNYLIRLQNDGDAFSGFDTGTGFDDPVFAVTAANDGSGDVFYGGEIGTYQTSTVNGIVRIDADGSID